jgi:peptide/nickel transport system ATP-binding protein/oligopeptide transport system ATP-binding protein
MILQIKNIKKHFVIERGIFKSKAGVVKALDDVSFTMEEFKTLGVVGESGSGKSTLAKVILALIPPTAGTVVFDEHLITNFRKDVQIIFQNPYNSLNPKMRIKDIIAEPLLIHRIVPRCQIDARVIELIQMVGLDKTVVHRLPIEFSGGQRQRLCIARSLASEPKFIVLDEPVSSLDLTIQAQMLDLFLELKEKFKLTYIFISHNLAVIKHIADYVVVMQHGRIVEQNDNKAIFNNPIHPYTQILLEAAKT